MNERDGMEKLYVNDLSQYINQEITSFFLVSQKELRDGKRDRYIRLRLTDKTGNLAANIWNNANTFKDKFEEGDVVKIQGIVISYKEQTQITVNKIRTAEDHEYDIAEFIPVTSKDIDKLSEALFFYIDKITDTHLNQLLHIIFDDKEFFRLFARCPAAKGWHHNYMGGLLEHTISVTKICDFAIRMYPAQSDLLLTGAILHDIGKVFEYSQKAVIDFTDMGRLIGHIVMGDELICKTAAKVDNFPDNLLMKLRHLILAHHGEFEKGAARVPQMLEAIILHHADNLDAQTVGVAQLQESAQKSGSAWSEFDRLNNRYYYLG